MGYAMVDATVVKGGQRFDTVGVPPVIEGLAFDALVAEGIRQQRHYRRSQRARREPAKISALSPLN